MADDKKVYIDLQVRAGEAEKRLADLIKQLAALKAEQKEHDKALKESIKAQREVSKTIDLTNQDYDRQRAAIDALEHTGRLNAASAEAQRQELENLRAQAIAPLTAEFERLNEAEEANAAALASIQAQIKPLSAEYQRAQLDAKHVAEAQGDSLKAMRAQLLLLQSDYDKLSEAERETAAGQDLQAKIASLNKEVLELEGSTGRFQRNVGNYQSIWEANAEKIEGFGGVLAKVFGENSIVTKTYTTIAGFGRQIDQNMGQSSPTAQASATVNAMGAAAQQTGDRVEQAGRRTIGFRSATQQAGATAQQTGASMAGEAGASTILAGGLKGATTATMGMIKASLAFIATPLGLVLAAIAGAIAIVVAGFKRLRDAIKRSDDASTAFDSLRARFQSIGQAIGKIFDFIVKAITPVIEGISKFVGAILSIIPIVNKVSEANEEAIRVLDKLQDAERAAQIASAKRAKELAKLEQIYNDNTKSAKERAAAMEEAVKIEQEGAKETLRLAQMKLKIKLAELKASGDTSDAAKDELTKLQAAVIEAEAQVDKIEADATRRLSRFRAQQASEAAAAAKARTEALKKAEEELLKQQRENVDARVQMVADEYLRAEMVAKINYDRQRDELERRLKEQQAIRAKYSAQGSEEYQNAVKQENEIKQAIEIAEKQHQSVMLSLARQHQADIRTINASNAELSAQLIADEDEREKALHELTMRRLDEEAQEVFDTYAERQKAIQEAYSAGQIDLETYQRQSVNATAEYYAKLEAIDLKTKKAQQERMSALYTANLKAIDENLKAIDNLYKEEIANVAQNDYDAQLDILEQRKEELHDLFDNIATMSEEEAIEQYGSLDEWKEKVQGIAEAYKEADNDIEEHNAKMVELTKRQVANAVNNVKALTSSISNFYKQRYDDIVNSGEELTESQKEQALSYAESQYHATLAGIILEQAQGMAATYAAGAKAMLETPGGSIAKIAAMTAVVAGGLSTLLSGITAARQATSTYNEQKSKIAKMARGGLVEGAGTGTSDSIPAMLSNGESVMTARATAAHYETLSRWNVEGGGRPFPGLTGYKFAAGGVAVDWQGMANVVRAAVADVQPVVSVKEITRVANRVKVKETMI